MNFYVICNYLLIKQKDVNYLWPNHSTLLIKKLFDHRPTIIRTKKGTKSQRHSDKITVKC